MLRTVTIVLRERSTIGSLDEKEGRFATILPWSSINALNAGRESQLSDSLEV